MSLAVQESLDFIITIIETIPNTPFIFLIGLMIVLTIIRGLFEFMNI